MKRFACLLVIGVLIPLSAVMAQGNVFIEKTDVNFSGYVDFIPAEVLVGGTNKIILSIYDEDEECFLGYQVVDENLEIEKEFKNYKAQKLCCFSC